jgi:two-component system LytT family response regulator
MSIRALVCEDEPLARETLRDFISASAELVLVGEAPNGREALKLIRALAPDLVFMDIQMPELTGLEVVRQLIGAGEPVPPLIFTTAYDQHAVTAFELHALDYLLKPFTRARFDAAVARVLSAPAASAERGAAAMAALGSKPGEPLSRILVRDRGRIFPLALDEIEHLRADLKYTQIMARGESFLVRMPLSELEARLDASRFLRVHRNAIVNLDFVASMRPDEQSQLQILMKDGTELLANREASKRLRDMAI